jgi:hypothetical protein
VGGLYSGLGAGLAGTVIQVGSETLTDKRTLPTFMRMDGSEEVMQRKYKVAFQRVWNWCWVLLPVPLLNCLHFLLL